MNFKQIYPDPMSQVCVWDVDWDHPDEQDFQTHQDRRKDVLYARQQRLLVKAAQRRQGNALERLVAENIELVLAVQDINARGVFSPAEVAITRQYQQRLNELLEAVDA
jgi:hypothetical protein